MNEDLGPADRRMAWWILTMNTFAFTVCFAAWMMNGVLVTFLVDNAIYDWDPAAMGWLIGIPVLTGSLFRLPLGVVTDKWGGRIVYGLLLLLAAVPMFLVGYCDTYWHFFLAGLGFGFSGTSFAIGIAYTSVWFPKRLQGTALGIFGAGNAGAALTALGAPQVLNWLTDNGESLEGWRHLPKVYAVMLAVTGVLFLLTTKTRIPVGSAQKTLGQRLTPLKSVRVWRFGLYYFFCFGGFVALAQWLIPYYVNAYAMTVATAGMMASCFSLPSGLVRAFGGYMSDKKGARKVMYMVLSVCVGACVLLIAPRMDIESPGSGVMARRSGTVTSVSPGQIIVDEKSYKLEIEHGSLTEEERMNEMLVLPRFGSWHEPVVKVGDKVTKKQLLARGITHIYFQANVWIFTALVFILGTCMGIGCAAIYKHIPDYFPKDVGVVGGIVGVLGGLGGFFCPILFGYLLKFTGIWTTCWMFFALLSGGCLWWMHTVIQRMLRKELPALAIEIDSTRSEERLKLQSDGQGQP